jgi:hypothetical protein
VKLAAHRPETLTPGPRTNERVGVRLVQRQTWAFIGISVALFAIVRFYLGPLPQDPSYHSFADTRALGPIPRAGDVLTNAAILAAGIAGLVFWRRVRIAPDERPAYALLVFASLATALGSAYYHALPSDARLVWDRLPMTLIIAALFALVLADRAHPAFARIAWWPVALLGAGSVFWWAWTGRAGGGGDLLLYGVVRILTGLGIAWLVFSRSGRHTRAGWLIAAMTLGVVMTVCELRDRQIFAATRGFISGHSVKHLLAGALLGCVLAWLALREPRTAVERQQQRVPAKRA